MSDISIDSRYSQVAMLADDISVIFAKDGKYDSENRGEKIECDVLVECTGEQRAYILVEVRSLITSLKKDSKRIYELEKFLEGDTGAESYLERLKEIN